MKHFLLLLILLTLVILTLWLASFAIPCERTFTTAQNTYHLSNRHGTFLLSTFSNTPEDDSYRSFHLPYWLLSVATISPTLGLAFYLQRKRRTAAEHGFPVSPSISPPKR